jgi:hypothetical protein
VRGSKPAQQPWGLVVGSNFNERDGMPKVQSQRSAWNSQPHRFVFPLRGAVHQAALPPLGPQFSEYLGRGG